MNTITITVTPSHDDGGRHKAGQRGPVFDASVSHAVVTRSPIPLCDAARALLKDGVRPETRLVMRHAGSDHDALVTTVGTAATLTVSEGADRPRLARWTPYHNDNMPESDTSETEMPEKAAASGRP